MGRSLPATREAGFTLIELVIVIVVAGVVAAYVAMRSSSAGVYTLLSQAETLASDLRHAQALANTLGKSVQVSITSGVNGSYSVSCVTPGSAPCNGTSGPPMTNPATGSAFSVTLDKSVALSYVLNGSTTFTFNSLGKPSGTATYTLTAGGISETVTVANVTGRVSVP